MTSDLEALARAAGAEQVEHRGDGTWVAADGLDLVALAQAMRGRGARLCTITGRAADPRTGKETELIYHYILGPEALHVRARTTGNRIASIAGVLPAAEWIEREIQDLYEVEFTGHPNPGRLIRPPELPPGFFR